MSVADPEPVAEAPEEQELVFAEVAPWTAVVPVAPELVHHLDPHLPRGRPSIVGGDGGVGVAAAPAPAAGRPGPVVAQRRVPVVELLGVDVDLLLVHPATGPEHPVVRVGFPGCRASAVAREILQQPGAR